MTNTTTPTQHFRFRDLPAELRNKIYRVMLCEFTTADEPIQCSLSFLALTPPPGISTFDVPRHAVTAILRTSKQTYQEAYDVMVRTNRFVRITVDEGIPICETFAGQGVPILCMGGGFVQGFKGYVLDVHLGFKHPDTLGKEDCDGLVCMVLHRDLDKVCKAIDDVNAHLQGFSNMSKMSVTVAPVLDTVRDKTLSPTFDDFFAKSTQQALLKPFTAYLHGYQSVEINGHVDRALAADVREQLAQDRYSNPAALLAKATAEKEQGTRLFQQRATEEAAGCWLDAALDIDNTRESTAWPKLVRRGGQDFVSQLAHVYFVMQLNIVHIYLQEMPGFVGERLAENALNMAVRSIRQDYWMNEYKYRPPVTLFAKLLFRNATFYRLKGDPRKASQALMYIEKALQVQPGDATLVREREKILEWKEGL
ncbi:tetratricopeptide-like helical [Pyrenophora seminiperda CCB06]|uniref:Tetratricopeptide-like helical n=1 Tax=Pyrenophora seminiperda CCB06 TaxID=1302712 RepID=A0A3M7ME72_9PLEO|nr:tetratricopeptide-like helical [Pyrenophora seminiperda CCB06]